MRSVVCGAEHDHVFMVGLFMQKQQTGFVAAFPQMVHD